MSPGAVGDARVTQKCRTCGENHGVFRLGGKCEACTGTGLVRSPVCEGRPGFKRVDVATGQAAAVKRPGLWGGEAFSAERCGDCAGEGWLSPRIALACPRCAGLGVRLRPASDPSKILD
jgi:DnaJ-class molecular chaperone